MRLPTIMQIPQLLILAILLATVAAFLWGCWRHDVVAAGSLPACVLAGLVAPADAFNCSRALGPAAFH